MNNLINRNIQIISDKGTVFTSGFKFEIPIYQRGYEWEEEHIDKLIDDILNNDDDHYYLGILVLSKNKKKNLTLSPILFLFSLIILLTSDNPYPCPSPFVVYFVLLTLFISILPS